jgi:hypothetical protein
MSLEAALDVVGRVRDHYTPVRVYQATRQLRSIARIEPRVPAKTFRTDSEETFRTAQETFRTDAEDLLDCFQPQCKRPDFREHVEKPLSRHFGSSLITPLVKSLDDSRRSGAKHPCAYPKTKSTIESDSNVLETKLNSRYIVQAPLDDKLKEALDPRNWDQTGELFAETTRIPKPDGRSIDRSSRKDEAWTVRKKGARGGEPGYLFERAATGFQEIENILTIERTDETPWSIEYRLFRGESYRVAGIEISGIMRKNDGYLKARPCHNDEWTEVEVEKRVRYGRLSTWSGSGMVDYGEVLNYAARAFLVEWVHHLALVPPCAGGQP